MKLTLVRGIWRYDKSQIGLIYPVTIHPLFVLELPWIENKRRISCIPTGTYKCIRKPSTKNGTWKEAFFVEDVPDRYDIICGHLGNEPGNSLGCMLFGLYHDAPNHIKNSREAIFMWRRAMTEYNEFELEIIE